METACPKTLKIKEDSIKRIALPLAALLAYSLYVMLHAEQSLIQFGLQLMPRPDTAQVVIDLYLLATLPCVWMYQDAKACGKSLAYLLPYFALTALLVSVGPLLYLVVRGCSKPSSPDQAQQAKKSVCP